ncbi:MAG: hypothetical protein ACOC2W_00370 [bacterium]
MSLITIKNNDLELKFNKKMLVDVDQTPDGIVFNFQGGSNYFVVATYMPIETKEKIKHSTNAFENANIIIDLNNYQNPVYADLTK